MPAISFSTDGGFDFAVRCVLSGVGYGMADPGEVLTAAARVDPGDVDGWYATWTELGARCDAIAAAAEAAGHRESAAQAWLRAANYRFAGFWYVLATSRRDEHGEAWRAHRASLERAFAAWSPPVEPFTVSHDGTDLAAWRFRGVGGRTETHPVLLVHNGLGSPLSDVFMTGAADAAARGWDAVAFDGPGQGRARFVDGVGPVDDWGPVGRAVVDAVCELDGVDTARIASSGIADGGYLAAVHAAADDRVAALVCDPGVVRPLAGALGGLPEDLQQAWEHDDHGLLAGPLDAGSRFAVAKLTEQWLGAGAAEVLGRLASWDLAPQVPSIRCPTLVADPESAEAFAGQSAELASLLGDRATLVPFTDAEGAGLDCEIGAPRLRNQRVFDWLDEVVVRDGPPSAPGRSG